MSGSLGSEELTVNDNGSKAGFALVITTRFTYVLGLLLKMNTTRQRNVSD